MTTTTTTTRGAGAIRIADRRAPAWGGFTVGLLGKELKRSLRNKRVLIFTVFMPVLFLFLFAGANAESVAFEHGNLAAYFLISMGLYGGMMAAATGGASVALERGLGWSRQLRLTPLSPAAYTMIKLLSAAVRSALSVAVVYAVAFAMRNAHMTTSAWVESFIIVWVGSFVFAAFGLMMGFLMKSDSVMQILSFVLVILAFLGGLFAPVDQYPQWLQEVARFTPAYGLHQIAVWPLVGGQLDVAPVVNVCVWFTVFASATALLFRRDTARV